MDITFVEFEGAIRHLYDNGDYGKVIELIDERGSTFPEQQLYLDYWRIGMAARMHNFTLAYHFMDELAQAGQWIDRNLMLKSPSLEGLLELQDYQIRLDRFWELQQQEFSQLLPLISLHNKTGCTEAEPCPVLLGFHEDRQIALQAVPHWKRMAEEGWLVGLPQSSQALWSQAYVWEDRVLAQQEISGHLNKLSDSYHVDARRIVSAGSGLSAELALWLPLSRGIDVRGMLAVNPHGSYFAQPDRWLRLMQASQISGARAAILVELEEGETAQPELLRTVEIFNTFDMPTTLLSLPAGAPVGGKDYESVLLSGIDFILS